MFLRSLLICMLTFLGCFMTHQQLFAKSSSDFLPVVLSDSVVFQKIPETKIGFVIADRNNLTIDNLVDQDFQSLAHRPPMEIVQKGFNYWAVIKVVNQ